MARKAYHHGDLRRAVIDTAMAMLVEDGDWRFTLREVARRAGVSHAAPYKHFADKSVLLGELALIGFDRLYEALQVPTRDSGDFDAELIGMARAYLNFGARNPALYHLMFGADVARSFELHLQPRAMAPFLLLVDTLTRGQSAGWISDRPVRGLAASCWAQLHGLTTLRLDGLLRVEKVGADAVEVAVATLLSGVKSN
ncbi:TetR/AcrR family transcriptional regulator [Paracoccus albus]|uniref:TetR/AcrR family transcriptional regulator n=1 Tax=Paracoccus albus TaxID=3017784 RepID=UPI0022F0CB63|nr:TetR/AcrR family transcriptional regulator [Paracoccus albus]WBU61661.1 TetR/AcrR family transcriptional regulator [Paracoccus albus]